MADPGRESHEAEAEIRATHRNAFRRDEWATLWGVMQTRGRDCYFVRFPDGETDQWPVDDPTAAYEFRS